jgi:serine/threonine-protein kinase
MKFRFRRSNTPLRQKSPRDRRKSLILRGKNTPKLKRSKALIGTSFADEFDIFKTEKRSSVFKAIAFKIRKLRERFRQKLAKRLNREPKISLPTLLGILSSIAVITVLAGALVIFSLFFTYGGAYTAVKIPNFISLNEKEATSFSNDIFEYEVKYESNPDHKSGKVIAQSPLPNVTRKLYKNDGKLKITLTVNKEPSYVTLPQMEGTPLRDALLKLKPQGIQVQIIEEYSQVFPSGTIISSSRKKGYKMKSGDVLTLKVSKGKQEISITVPDLVGKSEPEAISILESKGIRINEIRYESSKDKAGTVIAQDISAGTEVKEGYKISFTVSGGMYYSPD